MAILSGSALGYRAEHHRSSSSAQGQGKNQPGTCIVTKRIPISELRLGMYIHKLGGSWLNHPFLRGSFLLTDAKDLTALRACGIDDVWIDVAKSQLAQSPESGIQTSAPTTQNPEPREPSEAPSKPPGVQAAWAARCDWPLRLRARKICLAAKTQVMAMFDEPRLGHAVDPESTLPLVAEIAESVQRSCIRDHSPALTSFLTAIRLNDS